MTTLKERIDSAMKLSGLTQKQLAEACGIKVPSVSDWVTGKTKSLRGSTATKAAKALGVSPAWLSDGIEPMQIQEGDGHRLSDQEAALLEAFSRLPDKERALFLAEVKYKAEVAEINAPEIWSGKERRLA